MTREVALMYLTYCVDDALNERKLKHRPSMSPMYLAVWERKIDPPIVVAVWSYLGARLSHDEVTELATDLLIEKLLLPPGASKPDYIL